MDGLFQVKRHFNESADLAIINKSGLMLAELLEKANPHVEIFMNYPGIGYGGLERDEVETVIGNVLPDNVTCFIR